MNLQEQYDVYVSDSFDPYTDKVFVLLNDVIEFDLDWFDGKSLDESISILQEYKNCYDAETTLAIWKTDYVGYYDTPIASLGLYRVETDAEFQLRQKKYNTRKK